MSRFITSRYVNELSFLQAQSGFYGTTLTSIFFFVVKLAGVVFYEKNVMHVYEESAGVCISERSQAVLKS